MDNRIVVNPSRKYIELEHSASHLPTVRVGMIALGLEIETHARLCEDLEGVALDDTIKFAVSAALRATLQSVGIADEVHDAYTKLLEETNHSVGAAYQQGPGTFASHDAPSSASSREVSARQQPVSGAFSSMLSPPPVSSPASDPPPTQLSFGSEESLREEDRRSWMVALDEEIEEATWSEE